MCLFFIIFMGLIFSSCKNPMGTPEVLSVQFGVSQTEAINTTENTCGNGTIDEGEVCDDGDTKTELTCGHNQTCNSCNSDCSAEINLVGSYCGDGSNDTEEVCDDGNVVNELTCGYSQTCNTCNSDCSAEINLVGSYCGDGVIDTSDGEECDDTTNGGDNHYCDADCTIKDNFVSIWDITVDDKTLDLPLPQTVTSYQTDGSCNTSSSSQALSYNFIVDWGDNTTSEVTSFDDPDKTHIYAEAGEYTVKITGTMEGISFNGTYDTGVKDVEDRLLSIPNLGNVGWKSFDKAFRACESLELVRGGNTSSVLNMYQMFWQSKLATPETSSWDTSSVTTMNQTFLGALKVNPDTSNWNTENVTNMTYMFAFARDAQMVVSSWDVSKVTNISYMFYRTKLGVVDEIVQGVTVGADFDRVPNYAEINNSFSNWNTSCVNTMDTMFRESVIDPNTTDWDTSNVTTLKSMFYQNNFADPDVANWVTSKVTNMYSIFYQAEEANPDVTGWDTAKVEDMYGTFYKASKANPDLSNWNFSIVDLDNNKLNHFLTNTAITCANKQKFLEAADSTAPVPAGGTVVQPMITAPDGAEKTSLEIKGWTFLGDCTL
jgi:hypothetical protein